MSLSTYVISTEWKKRALSGAEVKVTYTSVFLALFLYAARCGLVASLGSWMGIYIAKFFCMTVGSRFLPIFETFLYFAL